MLRHRHPNHGPNKVRTTMNDELNIDTTIYDEEYDQQQLDAALQKGEADRQAAEAEQAAPSRSS